MLINLPNLVKRFKAILAWLLSKEYAYMLSLKYINLPNLVKRFKPFEVHLLSKEQTYTLLIKYINWVCDSNMFPSKLVIVG